MQCTESPSDRAWHIAHSQRLVRIAVVHIAASSLVGEGEALTWAGRGVRPAQQLAAGVQRRGPFWRWWLWPSQAQYRTFSKPIKEAAFLLMLLLTGILSKIKQRFTPTWSKAWNRVGKGRPSVSCISRLRRRCSSSSHHQMVKAAGALPGLTHGWEEDTPSRHLEQMTCPQPGSRQTQATCWLLAYNSN